jgi:hypothetical protein
VWVIVGFVVAIAVGSICAVGDGVVIAVSVGDGVTVIVTSSTWPPHPASKPNDNKHTADFIQRDRMLPYLIHNRSFIPIDGRDELEKLLNLNI